MSRGRRQKKLRHPMSRSPSPSVVPTTPVDEPLVASPTSCLEQPDDLHLDAEFSRGRSSLRSLASDSVHDGGKHRVLTYGREMNNWAAHAIPEIEMEPVLSTDDAADDSKNRVSRSADTLPLMLSSTETSTCWRQRPNSSPPTVARLHSRIDTTPPTHLDAFVNTSASSSTAALIARSRSADAH
jgi:hypothetical protein